MEDNCDWCGSLVERPPSKLKRSKRTFCCADCQGKWESDNKSGSDSHNWEGGDVVVSCYVCDNERKERRSVVEDRERFFCSHECYGVWVSENRHSENHHQWKEDYSGNSYKGNWDSVSEEVRSEYPRCENCGMANGEHTRKYGLSLHVHHIQRYGEFDDPEVANQKENLVPLCVQCHHLADWEDLSVQSPYSNT